MSGRTAAALALGVGCGDAHVGGEVDGEPVGGARSALYDTFELAFGPVRYEAAIVVLSDFRDGCEVFEAFYDTALSAQTCETACDEYHETMDTFDLAFRDYWSTVITANVTEGTDGDFTYDPNGAEGTFNLSYTRWDATPIEDAAICEDACEEGDLLTSEAEVGEDGTLTLALEDDRLEGEFDVSLGGEDALQGRFEATRCDLADWFGF